MPSPQFEQRNQPGQYSLSDRWANFGELSVNVDVQDHGRIKMFFLRDGFTVAIPMTAEQAQALAEELLRGVNLLSSPAKAAA